MRKAIMGLVFLVFLLSGTALLLLTMEDKKDTSGRAYEIVSTEYTQWLAKQNANKDKATFSGNVDGVGKVSVNFDPAKWKLVDEKEALFVSLFDGTSVKVMSANTNVESYLKNAYTTVARKGKEEDAGEWKVTTYKVRLLSEDKEVQVWQRPASVWKLMAFSATKTIGSQQVVADFGSLIAVGAVDKSKVKGDSTTDESAKLTTLARPSVVRILNKYCTKLTVSLNDPDKLIAGKGYPFCMASTGSGFFINSEGDIATNGHVVKSDDDPLSIIYGGILSGQLDDFMVDAFASGIRSQGGAVDMAQIRAVVEKIKLQKASAVQMALTIEKMQKENLLSIPAGNYNYYVQLSKTALKLSKTGSVNVGQDIVEARLVGYDYQPMAEDGSFNSSDVAILKISGSGYPGLPLGSTDNLASGSSLEVLGFPGIVSGGSGSMLDSSAGSEPTVTRGLVSAIKNAKGDMKKLIQTDATINHGNSGGPAVDSQGNVIGIATYGLTVEDGSGNYNFLRDISDLKALAAKYNVKTTPGATYEKWKSGLTNYWMSYYRYAKEDFTAVSKFYPVHPTVERMLGDAKTKAGTSADLTPMFTKGQRKVLMVVAGIVMAGSLLALVGLALTGRRQGLTAAV